MSGVLGYTLLHNNTRLLTNKASSGGWGESDDAVLQTWTEAPPIGVDGEETSCLFEPEFQSGGRTGVTSVRRKGATIQLLFF